MSLLQRVLVSVSAAFILFVLYANADAEVDDKCLGCLCEAATQCNTTALCQKPTRNGYFCGPFQISWAYWVDAGKPVILHDRPEKKGAFENCANDKICAAKVVRQYMKNFAKEPEKGDCNGDGKVDCIDFAYMHRLGGYSCKDPSMINTTFYQRFHSCWQVVQAALPKNLS